MTRREWLEKFIWLADRNKPARDFRTKIGIRFADIPNEIKKLGKYREELEDILDAEDLEVALEESKNEEPVSFEKVKEELLSPRGKDYKFPQRLFDKLDELPKPPEEDNDKWELFLEDDE